MSEVKRIRLNRLILHEDNPRFEGVLNEDEAIRALCATEKVLELARDIAVHGLSPLERFMVFSEDLDDDPSDRNYVVAEGNRRLCALKLLKDPKKAPAHLREAFKRARVGVRLPRTVEVVIEEDEDERTKWVERAHAGTLGGKGRKAWNSTQKTRHFKNPRNLRGQALLDYAVARDFIGEDETQGRLSHLVRLIGNPVMRVAIGLQNGEKPQELFRDRPLEDFDKLLGWLMDEALSKDLGSQATAQEINARAAQLESDFECKLGRLQEQVPLSEDLLVSRSEEDEDREGDRGNEGNLDNEGAENSETSGSGGRMDHPPKPKRPEPSKNMPYSEVVQNGLKELKNFKLESLFFSISSIPIKDNVPALFAVAWSFLDSFSVAMGRPVEGNISQHWQRKNLLSRNMGYSRDTAGSVEKAFTRIRGHGNDTKHHPTSAGFDAEQLKSDWLLILPVLEHDLTEYLSNG